MLREAGTDPTQSYCGGAEPLLHRKLSWCLLPGKGVPCLVEPGWMCPAACVIRAAPLLPLLAVHSEGRHQKNVGACAWCRDDPLGSPPEYSIWTKFRAQPDWLQSPSTQPAWVRWQTRLSSSLPCKPSLTTTACWANGGYACKGVLASFSGVPKGISFYCVGCCFSH